MSIFALSYKLEGGIDMIQALLLFTLFIATRKTYEIIIRRNTQ